MTGINAIIVQYFYQQVKVMKFQNVRITGIEYIVFLVDFLISTT